MSTTHAWLAASAVFALTVCAAQSAPDTAVPWARHVIDNSSQGADGVRLADVNGDGLLDIATGWEEGGQVRVYLNPGPERAAQPWPTVTVGTVASPEDAVFTDVNGDGVLDVVSSTEGKVRTIFFHIALSDRETYLDPETWRTQALPASTNQKQWMFVLPFDVDGRNGIDLVAGAKDEGAQIGWFEAPAKPNQLSAWKWHPFYDAGWIMSLVPADIDGDGDLDILASDRKGPQRGALWIENRGKGGNWPVHRIGAVNENEVMFLDWADLDNDGLEDVLVAVREGPILFHRRASNAPVLWETYSIDLPAGAGTGKSVAAGDIDLDGKPDLVFSSENASDDKHGVMWLSYDKTPMDKTRKAHPISGPLGIKFDLVNLIDLDGDGDLDVLTCEESENLGVIWYENPAR